MDGIYYFTYSQHMDPIHLRRMRIPFRFCISAYLPNYRLTFNVLEDELFRFEKRGLANITPDVGEKVEGVLYEIREDDFSKLDNDVGVLDLKYYRKLVLAYSQTGDVFSAMTYAAWPDVTSRGLLPRGDYLNHLLHAARQIGISNEFCHWLESHPTTI